MRQYQATIVGYGGKPMTLFSAYDPDSRVLVIAKESAYRTDRRPGCAVITNDTSIPRDALFGDTDLTAAIQAYFGLQSGIAADGKSNRLVFSDAVARTNPGQAIEKDGMDATGPRYRISEGVSCGHIAALATCLIASRSDTVEASVAMAGTLQRILQSILRGEAVSL